MHWLLCTTRFAYLYHIQGEAHKVLQTDSTQTIDHIQKCFRQKFQCSKRPSYWTILFFLSVEALKLRQGLINFFKWNHVFFSMTGMTLCCRFAEFVLKSVVMSSKKNTRLHLKKWSWPWHSFSASTDKKS